ncbi:MAG TPA: pyruvate ferredoxin oxidoreductase [Firmicutes bacterium]|nr:pyruvate ferredoxin oxidoreductase [Bacillota bacterium]
MTQTDVVISGFGGQGVILTGLVLGKTVSIFSDGFATMTQNFGPEARGGACTAQVVVDDEPIRYPYVQKPSILIAMSQEAFQKHEPNLIPGGILLYEDELVDPNNIRSDIRAYGVPAARFAEELGNSMVLNIIMLGFLSGVTGLVTPEACKKAIASSVPGHLVALNHKAFDKGYDYGRGKIATEQISDAVKEAK